jgi:hypothetical protein
MCSAARDTARLWKHNAIWIVYETRAPSDCRDALCVDDLRIDAGVDSAWRASPKRGGIMVNAGEMTLEFVIRDGMVVVYPDDHGEPVRAQGAEATLVLTAWTRRARHSEPCCGRQRLRSVWHRCQDR